MEAVGKVYGPYYRKDGRQHVIVHYKSGKKRTVSYPKWLMEQHLGRELDPVLETVDHIDRDFTNNELSNLRVISLHDHLQQDAIRVELVTITCVLCGKTAKKRANNLAHNSKLGKAGPFCGKVCVGKYGAALQNLRQERLPVQPGVETRDYYTLKDRPEAVSSDGSD